MMFDMLQGSRSTDLFPLIQFNHDLIQNEKAIGREEKIEFVLVQQDS